MEILFQKMGFALAHDGIGKFYKRDDLRIRRFSDDRFLIVRERPKVKLFEGRIDSPEFAKQLIRNIS